MPVRCRISPAMPKSKAMEIPCAKIRTGRAVCAEQCAAGDAEENVTHVHHARIAEHPIEALLRDGDQPDVDDVAEQEHNQKRVPLLRALRQKRERDTQKAVKPEFFQHARMQHRGGRRGGSVGFRRPGVEREERDQNAEPDQQQQKNIALGAGRDLGGRFLQFAEIKDCARLPARSDKA